MMITRFVKERPGVRTLKVVVFARLQLPTLEVQLVFPNVVNSFGILIVIDVWLDKNEESKAKGEDKVKVMLDASVDIIWLFELTDIDVIT